MATGRPRCLVLDRWNDSRACRTTPTHNTPHTHTPIGDRCFSSVQTSEHRNRRTQLSAVLLLLLRVCRVRPPARPPVTRRARRPDGRTASAAPRGAVDRKAPPATSRQPASVSAVATCLPTLSLSRGLAGSSVNAPLIITQDWALGGAGPVRRGNDQPERTRDA